MKLTSQMLQSLIREEKDRLTEATVSQETKTVRNPNTGESERLNITAMATRLANSALDDAGVIDRVAQQAKRIAQGHDQERNATEAESNMTGFPNRKDIDEACGDPEMLPDSTHHDEDHEGSMAKRQMFKTAEYAATIFDMLEDDEELPAWIQSKLTKVADYIGVVKHYLEYDKLVDDYPANRRDNPPAFTVVLENDKTGKRRTVHVWNGAVDEEDAGRRAKGTSPFAGNKDWKVASVERKRLEKPVEEASTKSKKKWTDADHEKQEKIAKEIEKDNPGISKQKKMAFAGAQVNRDKRKRKKKK